MKKNCCSVHFLICNNYAKKIFVFRRYLGVSFPFGVQGTHNACQLCKNCSIDDRDSYRYINDMKKPTVLNRRFKETIYRRFAIKIIILNVFVFLVTDYLWPKGFYYLAMIPSFVRHGYLYQLFTYMFVHGSFNHLIFNMLSLLIFGTMVEKRIGSKEFLLFYLLTGLFSGIISFISYYLGGMNVVLVGASGAIYGVLLLFAVFFPYSVIFVFGIIPVRAPILIIIYALIELYSQVFGRGGNVAHLTHLSGLAFAYLYCRIRMRINPFEVFRRTL